MRQISIAILFAALISLFAVDSRAGNGEKGKDGFFRLDPALTTDDYQAGSMLVKLKPEHRDIFSGVGSASNRVSSFFSQINVSSAQTLMPQQAIVKANQRRSKPTSVDLSLYYEVRFPAGMSIEEAINEMYALDIADVVEPNYNYRSHLTPDDPELDRQDYLEVIRAFEAWDITTGSEDVVIAIIDSGLDLDHPDLADAIFINEGEIPDNGIDDDNDGFIDNVFGWDFAGDDFNNIIQDNDPQVTDEVDNSHGVRVAGCATATTNNGVGVASVGYRSKIMALKMSADNDDRDNGGGFILNSLQGVLYAANNGADIINASFGGPNRSRIAEDIFNFVTFDLGVLVVASAGNANNSDLNFPASYPGVLNVAATDSDDRKAGFSNFGNSVDISAPGVAIFTTTFNDRYTSTQGTSFSSPIVAGAAALVKSQYPELSGFQIGEVLRTTADPEFYRNLASVFDNQMGQGRLDVERALTTQLPSIRIESSDLLNADGNIAQAGEDAFLFFDFKNWLWPSSSNLEARISTSSRNVSITQDRVSVGIVGTEQTVNNSRTPFQLSISESTPENTMIDILVEYSDGEYQDYEFFSVLVNPTFLNLQENNVSTTLSNNGRLGFQDTQQEDGIGFIIGGNNLLFEMGLVMGTSENTIVSNTRNADGGTDTDFASAGPIGFNRPGTVAAAEINGSFDDSNSGELGIDFDYRGMAWKSDADANYIIVEYEVTNTSGAGIEDLYMGLFADWDINQDNFQDFADYDEATQTGYIFSGDPNELRFAGIQVLNAAANYYAITNDHDIADNPLGIYDGFTDEEKFRSISGGIARAQAGQEVDGGTDVSHVVSAGPLAIADGETVTVAFAIHGTNSLDELIASAEAADILYNQTLTAPVPTATDVEVCYGGTADLSAAGASAFNWYTDISGGDPISSGADFSTGAIFNDSTFYVSNADESFESARTAVKVTVAANPEITVNGASVLCEGDEVQLTVAEADSYLWSTGETTQSIIVTQAGDYSVQVTDGGLGCDATSESVSISVNPIPTADFTIDLTAPAQGDEITFTDASTDATSWFWDFDDGTTSTLQNPTHTYTRAGEFLVNLQVTNAAGCADLIALSISVVTGIDPSQLLEGVSLFPNPAVNTLNITVDNETLGEVELSVMNYAGQLLSSTTLNKERVQLQHTLDLNGLDQGMYLIQVRQADRLNVFRVVKQ